MRESNSALYAVHFRNWELMSANRLKMNSDKTDFIWLGFKQQLVKIQCQFICLPQWSAHSSFNWSPCLGVRFDSQLTFTPHVQCLARRLFDYLRQLWTVRKSLTTDSAKTLVHALIAGRLDYCNSVLYLINTNAMKTLQSVLHSAARLIMRTQKFDHTTPTLRDDLHWLPVSQGSLTNYAPSSISVCTNLLQSTYRNCTYGNTCELSLSALSCSRWSAGPCNLNCYLRPSCMCPQTLEQPSNYTLTLTFIQFCSQLKTYLFGLTFGSASWLFRMLDRAV